MGHVTIKSAMLNGIDAIPVDAEVSVGQGLPGFQIVGLPDVAVLESAARVRAAIMAADFSMPNEKIIVNLAPATLKKHGSGFDLAIAIGILVATGQVSPTCADRNIFVGELGLDGGVLPVRGADCFAYHAQLFGEKVVMSADADVSFGGWSGSALAIGNLAELRGAPCFKSLDGAKQGDDMNSPVDFADINGCSRAKRACQIAAAGKLGLLFVGAHGSGKTMLASRIPSIMPEMSEDERGECARIASAWGGKMQDTRPFRAPHHSITNAGMLGGGNPVMPGEVALAHNGVLFLEDIAEIRLSTLQMLRQPIEDGKTQIVRADGIAEFPSDFMLVAAAQPCPCGNFGSERDCICSAENVSHYQDRICGPLGDAIPMSVDVWPDLLSQEKTASSTDLREGVARAWEYRAWRENTQGDTSDDAASVLKSCRLGEQTEEYLNESCSKLVLSGRSIVQVLTIARTIADIEQSMNVCQDHLVEALSLKNRYAN